MSRTFDALIDEAAEVSIEGWDFSCLDGRATEQRPSWGYQLLLGQKLATATAAIYIQTGGGEVLAGTGRASGALAMLFFAMAGAVFLHTQYLQLILDYTPLAAGFALVPAAIGMIVGSGASAHPTAKHGGRIAVAAGTLLAAVGLAVQAGYVDGTSYWPTGLGLLLFGLGAGVGSAVKATVREIGGARGVAIIGSVASTAYSSTLHADLAQVTGLSGLGPHYQPSTTANPTT